MSPNGRLRFPLPWGEGQGEGVIPIDSPYPLTPTLSPWERERSAPLASSRLTSGAHATTLIAEGSRHAAQ
jgi:hypothetical protein